MNPDFLLECPVPFSESDRILLAHGEGGRLSRRLIQRVISSAFDNDFLRPLGDGAVLPPMTESMVMSTDSYVVTPLFFPGGDIGKLAIHGTINDLAVCGAIPMYLSVGFILEEGLPFETFQRVIQSMAESAACCGVQIVTGDTKVVPRGAVDKLFAITTGIGRVRPGVGFAASLIQPGDRILISGTLGDHGIAILSAREGLQMDAARSDTAALTELVSILIEAEVEVHFLRDPTRGGVCTVLHELAETAHVTMLLEERSLPISEPVRGACELLGLDPLYIANEGKLLVVIHERDAQRALTALQRHPLGEHAAVIGEVMESGSEPVLVRNSFGVVRVLDEPSGTLLPRIC